VGHGGCVLLQTGDLRGGEFAGTVFGEFGRHDVSEAIGCGGR
jgi:hypothetical protein